MVMVWWGRWHHLTLHPLDVLSRTRIDLDDVPFIDEEGNVHRRTRFHFRRLRSGICAVALHPRHRFDHLEFESDRKFDAGDFRAVHENVNHDTVLQELRPLADLLPLHGKLLVRFLIHEDVAGCIVIEVLERLAFDAENVDRLACAETIFDDLSALEILQLGAHEGTPVPGVDVLEFNDRPRFVIVLNDQSRSKI